MAASVATEAMARSSPPIPKGSKKKAKEVKPTKDASNFSSIDTLPSGPNSPLPKSPLGSLVKLVGSLSVATAPKSPTKPSSPVASPISKPTNPKPSSSKAKDKGKAVASSPRYSDDNSYTHYFYEAKNERLFEKYITRRFIVDGPMKLESFRAVGVEIIVYERGWESTVSNIPRFFTKVIHEFYANLSNEMLV